jgi:hypothetical protein
MLNLSPRGQHAGSSPKQRALLALYLKCAGEIPRQMIRGRSNGTSEFRYRRLLVELRAPNTLKIFMKLVGRVGIEPTTN